MKLNSLPKQKWLISIAGIVIIAIFGWHNLNRSGSENRFKTAPIQRGDLLVTVSASGTVEPIEVIDVGAQVAGKIVSFGLDSNAKPVDYGSTVEEGNILAQIDDSLYAAEVTSAEAQLKRAQADSLQYRAKLIQAEQDWKRAEKLGPSSALSPSSFDAYKAGFEIAKANLAIGQASEQQAQANLTKAQRNLSYCTIRSPVKGVVIDRRVNIGQTVVSSLNAPSLFLLAKDLTRMQVWVAVNEADIGNIVPGQNVRFSVDAFPNSIFQGSVGKIRLNANMTQNVVTYTVEVNTDNSSGKLLPYLTANVQFEVSARKNVLLVPNTALRWSPKPDQVATQFTDKQIIKQTKSAQVSADPPKSNIGSQQVQDANNMGTVWIVENKFAIPLAVEVGGSDGIQSEILSAELKAGTEVIIGSSSNPNIGNQNNSNPFAPPVFRGRGRS